VSPLTWTAMCPHGMDVAWGISLGRSVPLCPTWHDQPHTRGYARYLPLLRGY
jgi:hypothetical protein